MSPRFIVVGGGISGLACAWRLSREAPGEVLQLEGSSRIGGSIRTERAEGFLLEHGPDSFLTAKPAAIDLCRALGLEGDFLPTTEANRRSFILRRGRLLPVPQGVYLLAPTSMAAVWASPLFSLRGKLRMAMEPFFPARRDPGDESLASFVRRRLGREALERLAQPMVAGIYSADPERLSLAATFPQFLDYERRDGSVIRGLSRRDPAAPKASGPRYGMFLTLRGGLSRWVEAIERSLPPGTVRLGAPAEGVVRAGGGWRVLLAGGEAVEAERLCLAVSAPRAGALLAGCGADSAAGELSRVPYRSMGTVALGYRREQVSHALDGMGLVVPSVEGLPISACSFVSSKFEGRAPEGKVLLRAFVPEEHLAGSDAEILERARSTLGRILGIEGEPVLSRLTRHDRAMPQYEVGHLDRVARIRAGIAPLGGIALAGNGYGGTGLPDCVASGISAAEELLKR